MFTSGSISAVRSILGCFIKLGGTTLFHCSIRELRVLSAISEWKFPDCELMMNTIGAEGGDEVVTSDAIRNRKGDNNFDIVIRNILLFLLFLRWIQNGLTAELILKYFYTLIRLLSWYDHYWFSIFFVCEHKSRLTVRDSGSGQLKAQSMHCLLFTAELLCWLLVFCHSSTRRNLVLDFKCIVFNEKCLISVLTSWVFTKHCLTKGNMILVSSSSGFKPCPN